MIYRGDASGYLCTFLIKEQVKDMEESQTIIKSLMEVTETVSVL